MTIKVKLEQACGCIMNELLLLPMCLDGFQMQPRVLLVRCVVCP